jgi:hypothetical protein
LAWVVMTNPPKPRVRLRFCEYELEEMNSLVEYYGGLPRSSIVNIALEELFGSKDEFVFRKCKKHKVKLAIDEPLLLKLNETAKIYSVQRTDLIRLAMRNFKLKYGTQQ